MRWMATVVSVEPEEPLMDRANLHNLFTHTLAFTLGVTTVGVAIFIAV